MEVLSTLSALFQGVSELDHWNQVPDSMSGEILIAVIIERLWSKYASWKETRTLDKRMDKFGEEIAFLRGKLH